MPAPVQEDVGWFGFVHDTHPTAAKLLDDRVVGDGLADEGVGLRYGAAILGRDRR